MIANVAAAARAADRAAAAATSVRRRRGRPLINARYVAQLEHPHIVPLYDYRRDPAGAYLVMQWPRAGSVADALQSRRFEPATAIRILGQIGSALSYAHRSGVFHRDLRPTSVSLDLHPYPG